LKRGKQDRVRKKERKKERKNERKERKQGEVAKRGRKRKGDDGRSL
jgi:hypothetical protein